MLWLKICYVVIWDAMIFGVCEIWARAKGVAIFILWEWHHFPSSYEYVFMTHKVYKCMWCIKILSCMRHGEHHNYCKQITDVYNVSFGFLFQVAQNCFMTWQHGYTIALVFTTPWFNNPIDNSMHLVSILTFISLLGHWLSHFVTSKWWT